MKSKFLTIIALISLVGLIFIYASCDPDKDIIQTTGNITGTVTEDGSTKPIVAADVTVSGHSQSYKTGSDGKYEIINLEEGNYKVTVSKKGYVADSKDLTVKAEQTTHGDFSLERDVPKLKVEPPQLDFANDIDQMTFSITNENYKKEMDWLIEVPKSADWLSVSKKTGTLEKGEEVITVYVDRSLMPNAKNYSANLIVRSTNGGGEAEITVNAEKQGAVLKVEPNSLDFGDNELEKTLLISNSTKIETINFNASANESWITLADNQGTISESETASIKVSVNRLGLAAGNHTGTIVVSSNKNTVTVNISMEVLAKQAPIVTSLQSSEVKDNSIDVSAYISSVGSAAVTEHGFCWGTSPNPTTADNKNNLGGTSTAKNFNSTLSGLTASTQYYIRAYATNEEGTTYSDAVTVTTLAPPTMAVVRTFAAEDVKYNQATCKGSIDDLGDGYVTAYGFCYSKTNPNPSLSDNSMSLGSTTATGEFSGDVTGLQEQTHYFIRAYATNSKGTAYGASVEITTPIAPPLVTAGLLAYYTFDNGNCDDYFGEENYCGILQGTGEAPTFTTDIPGVSGKSMKCTKGKYYYLTMAPDQSVNEYTYAAWVKTKSTGFIYSSDYNRLALYDNKVGYYKEYSSSNYFNIDLATILFDGKWHYVVITRKTNGRKLYIDGRFYKTGHKYSDPGSTATIGSDYMGQMDNLRIYNRALTQEEIKEIYNAKQ